MTTVHPNSASLRGSLKQTADYSATVTFGYDNETTGHFQLQSDVGNLATHQKVGKYFQFATNCFLIKRSQ